MSSADRVIGLIPAAGHATRLQPLESSKEALTVAGRPLMMHLVERMWAAGCSSIRVTTRPEKTDVIAISERHGADVVLANPANVSESLLAAVGDLDDETIVISGFPDTIWQPFDAFRMLLERARGGSDLVLGLFTVDEPERCDAVEVDDEGKIRRIVVKPDVPATDVTWGIFAGRTRVLRGLAGWPEPGEYFDWLLPSHSVEGVFLTGPYEDAGTPQSLTRLRDQPIYDERPEASAGDGITDDTHDSVHVRDTGDAR